MIVFIVRIQLIETSSDEYPPLWKVLEAKNFYRTVNATDGNAYRLPFGTYRYSEAGASVQTVLQAAKEAMNKAEVVGRVLVIEAKSGSWNNLEKDETSDDVFASFLKDI